MTEPAGVVRALTAVIGDLPAIGKTDKSKDMPYTFRGIEGITKELQPLLAKHGVVIVPKATITNVVHSPEMKPAWQDVYMTVQWDIYGPDGSSISACTTGIGRDHTDKGANKAQTQAYKYLLLHLLCIADVRDDADGKDYEFGRATKQDEPSEERTAAQDLAVRFSTLSGADKALIQKLAKEELGVANVMRAGDKAEAVGHLIDSLHKDQLPEEEPF
jgi:hypothetical protein